MKMMSKSLAKIIPPIWLSVFIILPILIILRIALSDSNIGILPFEHIIEWSENGDIQINITLSNFYFIFNNGIYLHSIVTSVTISFIAAVICLFIAYPMAYFIATSPKGIQPILLVLVIMPFWTSFIIRVYAWLGILSNSGLINSALLYLGIIDKPLDLLQGNAAIVMGIVYSYLPFMVLPLYSSLEKMDHSILEAAYDLGCSKSAAFFKITIPMSKKAIITGFSIVFIPGIGEYIVPELLGGSSNLMIGKVLWSEFFYTGNWPLACALAIIVIALMLLPFTLLNKSSDHSQDKKH